LARQTDREAYPEIKRELVKIELVMETYPLNPMLIVSKEALK
jgi:hypothetical protein